MPRKKKNKNCFHLNNARFTVLNKGCIRLEYSSTGTFSDKPTLVAYQRTYTPCPVTVKKTATSLIIITPDISLKYTDNGKPFSRGNLMIKWGNGKMTGRWHPGKRNRAIIGQTRHSLDAWPWRTSEAPIQGVLSLEGWYLLEDKAHATLDKDGYLTPQLPSPDMYTDCYFFAYGRDYAAALKMFIDVCGTIPMIPRWVFGLWYSRWYKYKARDFINIVRRFRKENIPLDVMVIDTDWRAGVWRGYDWNKKLFPKPKDMFKTLHKLHVKVPLNDHPGYDEPEPLPKNDSAIPKFEKRMGPAQRGKKGWTCYWEDARFVKAWRTLLLEPFFDEGMDFWWVDGWAGMNVPNLHPQVYINHHYYAMCIKKTKKRGLILSRFGAIGSHRYPIQFSGDTHGNWKTMKMLIPFTTESGAAGACYWSHDIGGFHEKHISEELYVRWTQCASFFPIIRLHSNHGYRAPWDFSKKAQMIFKKYISLRYALVPYWYSRAREAHDTGLPLMRPMFLNYPGSKTSYFFRYQFMVGDALMVAPAHRPIPKSKKTVLKHVWFPPGQWLNIENGRFIDGPTVKMIKIPYDRIPWYIKAGAVIPIEPVHGYITPRRRGTLHLFVFPAKTISGTVYDDDGSSLNYLKNEYRFISITGTTHIGEIKLTITGLHKNEQVHLEVIGGAESVSINGKKCRRKNNTSHALCGTIETSLEVQHFVTIPIKRK